MEKVAAIGTRSYILLSQGRQGVKLKEHLYTCSLDLMEKGREAKLGTINSFTATTLSVFTVSLLPSFPFFFLIKIALCSWNNFGKNQKILKKQTGKCNP